MTRTADLNLDATAPGSSGAIDLGQLRLVLEATPNGMVLVDDAGRIAMVNAHVERLFGYRSDELVGAPIERLIPVRLRDDHLGHRQGFAQMPHARPLGSDPPRVGLHRDGREVRVEIGLNPLRTAQGTFVLGSIVDVTRRIEAEHEREALLDRLRTLNEELRGRERWFATTLRSIADAVVAVDAVGKVRFMNPVAEALLGVAADAAVDQPLREVIEQDAAEGAMSLERALARREPVPVTEGVLFPLGQPRRVISETAAPVLDGETVLGAVMVFRDITEQRDAQRRVELTDRMMSLGTMAAGVAHEINNPLLVVTANAEFVELELRRAIEEAGAPGQPSAPAGLLAVADQAATLQGEMRSAALRIARIVADLGVFSRVRERVELRADLRRAVEWALRVTAHELRHRAETVVDLDPMPPVAIDEARLGQVLVNLLVNAALAIPSGRAEENSVRVRGAVRDGTTAIVEVRDTGSGIAPEVLPRIFEPFFTTRGAASGTGLGLSVCHGIITAVGGQIDVESEVGIGTCFRIELPLADPKPSATRPSIPIVPTRRARVLVVDDEEPILRAVRRGLGRHHDVVCTTRATEALALIAEGPGFDVIFSDLVMPNMTGMDFYDALLRRHPEAASKVVFLTGGTVDEQLSGFLARIPNRFFYKPIDLEVLLRAVDAVSAG